MAHMGKVYDEVLAERCAQDAEHGGPETDDRHSLNDWIAIAARHLGLATNDKAVETPSRFRRQMIRLAALAVAAVESFDRKRTAGPRTPEQLGKGF